MSVRQDWKKYLLTGIPRDLRDAISAEAAQLDLSLQETIRRILCERYEYDCEPVTIARGGQVGYKAHRDTGATTIQLHLQPEVWEALVQDSLTATIKDCILQALHAHYERTPA